MAGRITIEICKQVASAHWNVSVLDLDSARRRGELTEARHAAMWLACRLTPHTTVEIGRNFGQKDHSTVIYGRDAIQRRREAEPEFRSTIASLSAACGLVADSRLAEHFRGPDARQTAQRVLDGGVTSATMVSQSEIVAMARRLIALEAVASETFKLLSNSARLLQPFSQYSDRVPVVSLNKQLTVNIADLLEELGYTEETNDGQEKHKAGSARVHVAAAAE